MIPCGLAKTCKKLRQILAETTATSVNGKTNKRKKKPPYNDICRSSIDAQILFQPRVVVSFLPVPRLMFTRIGCARVGKGNFSRGGERRNESSRKARQLKVSVEIRECVKMEKIIGDENENIAHNNAGEV